MLTGPSIVMSISISTLQLVANVTSKRVKQGIQSVYMEKKKLASLHKGGYVE